MLPQPLFEAVQQKPFRPFRLFTTDGASYDVRHPEMLMVAPAAGYAIVGMPAAAGPALAIERHAVVDLEHIVRLEPITQAAATTGNGQS